MERKKQKVEPEATGSAGVQADTGESKTSKKPTAAYTPWNVHNWMIFLMERAPPLFFLLLAAGPCLTGLYSETTGLPVEKFIWALLGEQILVLVIRIMDDVKDYEKDKIVHPDRPLPRGLIKFEEVVKFIQIALTSTTVFAVLLSIRFGFIVGAAYGLQVFYAYMMYIEFGIGEWLEQYPFLYSFTHEISCYTGSMFMAALAGEGMFSRIALLYGNLAFSSFFVFDICRKLDPHLPKLKGTYLVIYGKWPVFVVTSLLVAMGMYTSYALGLHGLLWPLEIAMIGSLLFLFLRPTQDKKSKIHKPVEVLAVFYMLLHLWMPFFSKLLLSQ